MSPIRDESRHLDELLRRDVARVDARPSSELKQRVMAEVAGEAPTRRPVRARTTATSSWLALAAVAAALLLFVLLGGGEETVQPRPKVDLGVAEAAPSALQAGFEVSAPLVAQGTRQVQELGRALDGALVSELENLFLDVSLAAERVMDRLPLPRARGSRAN